MNSSSEHDYVQEDEIDLRELWQTIVKGKKIIAALSMLIVSLTIVYVLKLPNVYKSESILIPTQSESSGGLAGLGGLAAMAGISMGGGSMTPDVAFESLLNNYEFMKNFVIKHKIVEHYTDEGLDANYVFALGYRGVYDLFSSKPSAEEEGYKDYADQIFTTVNSIRGNFSISSDKKTALITVSYNDMDRTYPPHIINAFLKDASKYLVENNLANINSKLHYFEKELTNAEGFEIRQSLSAIISKIIQEKIMMQSKQYYQCDVLTAPTEAYIKDKLKPKRGLIVVVSFVTSIILGVFLVFFLEFIKKNEEEVIKL